MIKIAPHSLIVFDSGIGGISILRHLLNIGVPIIYFADQANFPYGDKEPMWLKDRLEKLWAKFALTKPLGLVIACNTATVSAVESARKFLSCPVFGVEPVVKPVAKFQNPVVWGTANTLTSERSQNLLDSHGQHVRYYTPKNLPSAIEGGDKPAINKILTQAKIDLPKIDAIGLSCTHYPLVKNQIEKFFPGVTIIDPSIAVTVQVKKILSNIINDLPSRLTYVSTKSSVRLKSQVRKFL